MKDPKDLTEPLDWTEAPNSLRSAFAAAQSDVPDESQLAELARSLPPMGGSAPPSPTSAAGSGSGGATATVGGSGVLAPIVAAIVVAALLVGGAVLWSRRHHDVPVTPAAIVAPVSSSAAATVPELAEKPAEPVTQESTTPEPSVQPKARTTPGRGSAESRTASPAPVDVVPEKSPPPEPPKISEAQLLDQARVALRTDPKRALQLADEHRRRFPHGVLAEEREVIAMQALKRLGLNDEARTRAKDFRSRHPESIHNPNVDQAAGD